MLLEVAESFSERGHVRQVKGHVAECVRRWPAFMQCDRDIVIAHRDAAFKGKQLLQTQRAPEPFRALRRIAHRQSEMTDDSQSERNLHGTTLQFAAGEVKPE